jgi:hypothetical protein
LATLLGAEAVTGAPAGLAVSVAAAALTGAAQAGGAAATIAKVMAMTKTQAVILGLVVISGAAVPMWVQHQNQMQGRQENQALRQQLQQLSSDNERLSNQVVQLSASPAVAPEQERELMRLRGEVGNLRRQVAEAAKAQPKASSPAVTTQTQTTPSPEEEQKQAGIARLNFTKGWLLSFMLYAEKNGDQLPSSFEQAAAFMPDEVKALALAAGDKYGLAPDQFEIVYQGSIKSVQLPATTILIREKQPWQNSDGSWSRSYGFADGHSEIHRAVDGNFAPWEAQHMAAPAAGQ